MAAAGLLASWAAALFAVWAFVGGLAAQAPGHPARRSAERALLASALAAAGATAALSALLLTGDVTISYVARSIARNVPAPYRLAAIWSLPAGAVLPTAVLVAVAGVIATARARSSLGLAAAGAIVMALCAASLAAAPFAVLPWVPTEGLGLSPALQHPWSVVGHASLSVAVALGATGVMLAADQLADGVPDVRRTRTASIVTGAALAVLAVAMWAAARGAFATGSGQSPAPPAAWGGALLPALVALVLARQGQRVGGVASFGAWLGALGLMCVVVLGARTRAADSAATAAFAIVSLGAAASGAAVAAAGALTGGARLLAQVAIVAFVGAAAATLWLTGGRLEWLGSTAQWLLLAGGVAMAASAALVRLPLRGATWAVPVGGVAGAALGLWIAPLQSPAAGWSVLAGLSLGVAVLHLADGRAVIERLPAVLLALAAAAASLAAAGEGRALTSTMALASGARGDVATRFGAPVTLVHQGVSRYQDRNAHVIAVALEPWRHARPLPLLSVEQREYVDSRDESLGPAVSRPVMFGTLAEEVRVGLVDVGGDEGVRVTVSVVPFASGWTVALALLIAAVLVHAVPRATLSPSPAAAGSTHLA